MSFFKSRKKVNMFLLIAIEGIIAFFWYLLIPSESKNIFIFGISKNRIIAGILFLIAQLVLFICYLLTKKVKNFENYIILKIEKLINREFLYKSLFFIFLAIFSSVVSIIIYNLPFLQITGFQTLVSIIINKFSPFLCWFAVCLLQLLTRLISFRSDTKRIKDSIPGGWIFVIVFLITIANLVFFSFRLKQQFLFSIWVYSYKVNYFTNLKWISIVVVFVTWICFFYFLMKKKIKGYWIYIAGLLIFFMTLFFLASGSGSLITSLETRYFSEQPMSHVVISACNEKPGNFNIISRYEFYKGNDFWLGTQPPGYFLFYSFLVGISKLVFQNINNCALGVGFLGSILFPILTFVNVFLITKIGQIFNLKNPVLAGMYFLIFPNIMYYSMAADQFLYPLLYTLTLWLVFRSKRLLDGLLIGILLYLELFISFKFIPLLAFIALWFLYLLVVNKTPLKEVLLYSLFMACGFLAVFFLFWIFFNYNPVTRYNNALTSNAIIDLSHKYKYLGGKTLLSQIKVLFLNNFEFAVWVGVFPFLLFLYEGIISIYHFIVKKYGSEEILIGSSFVVYILLSISGKVAGETSRLWMFFCPFLVMANCCKIRSMPHSDSGVCRTPIPEHAAQ